jgi:hypothetical protein
MEDNIKVGRAQYIWRWLVSTGSGMDQNQWNNNMNTVMILRI